MPPVDRSPERLIAASWKGNGKIFVQFADNCRGFVDLAQLGIEVAGLRTGTIRASSWGNAAEVTDNTGHVVHIDSSVLRAHIDSDYAAKLERDISSLG
jgi:hypothetical protein